MEHFIGPQLQSDIAEKLTETETDPHGRKIPDE
jgi:Mn-dependent DtxR family transcriptional regulator